MFYVTETRKDVELEVCNPQWANQVLTANMRDRESPLDIPRRRYARVEIGKEESDRMKQDLALSPAQAAILRLGRSIKKEEVRSWQ